MNKWQKGVLGNRVEEDAKILKKIKKAYQQAEKDIDAKIDALLARVDNENLQSIIYQVEYQRALKKQIGAILDDLSIKQFDDVSKYLTSSYENGYIGTMYDLHGQGIPLISPINQELVARSLKNNSKLSKNLWGSLYDRNSALQYALRAELSRGITQNYSYAQIAKNVSNQMGIGYNKIARIVRTESHRITNEATLDAQYKAKESGADVVKQWDATMDPRTRSNHRVLDGQLKELDEPFEVSGKTAMYPGGFGSASEDINCRCTILQRAKWALDEEELQALKERAAYFGLDKNDSFEEFKKKYLEAVKEIEVDPLAGKFFHMLPDGTLVEGKVPGLDVITKNGLTGEVTIFEKGHDYTEDTWTLQEDGTFKLGTVKNEAQYKIDIQNHEVLTVDLSNFSDLKVKYWEKYLKKDPATAKAKLVIDQLSDDLQHEVELEYFDTDDYVTALQNVLSKKGYKAIQIVNNTKDYQDLIDNSLNVFDDTLIKKTKKSKLETLQASLVTQQKKLNKIPNKTYSGIWQNDVNVSDYASKKDTIQAKKDYYNSKIQYIEDKLDVLGLTDPDDIEYYTENLNKFKKYLADLDEFEKLGQEYEALDTKISKLNQDISKLKPKAPTASGDAYSQERKDNAYWFTDSYDRGKSPNPGKGESVKGADNVLRATTGDVWRNATQAERTAAYNYTSGSGPFNRPLRGYEGDWGNYKGVGKVDLDYEGHGKDIENLTKLIDRSTYGFDMWLQRGVRSGGMASFLQISENDLYLSEKDLAAKLTGKVVKDDAFISTAVAKGKGFSGHILNIYAPKGTKMIYAEPFSAYGYGAKKNWDGISTQSNIGGEAEMLLQRGYNYRVTKVTKQGGTWYFDIEVLIDEEK